MSHHKSRNILSSELLSSTSRHKRYNLRHSSRPKATSYDKPRNTRFLEKDFRTNVPKPRYAYVTLVMCGDEYSQGALALAWSLRQQDTKHELVVMATPDVSVRALRLLKKLYDRVLSISYIETKVNCRLRGKRYREENKWMNHIMTKARMLKLTEYSKIIWLDADMLVTENIDSLFDVPAPAGICSSIRNHDYWHSTKLPELEVENSLRNNYGIYGCILILEPNLDDYLLSSSQPIVGDKASFVGPDDYFFTKLYQRKWYHLHVKYGCTRWHEDRLGIEPAVIHFVGAKPWGERDWVLCGEGSGEDEWAGLVQWREVVQDMVRECPVMKSTYAENITRKMHRSKSAMPLLRMITA